MMTEGEVSTKTTIDASLERYKIENFKNTNAKRVPYEEIDYNIYKSSHVDFSTTEKRLPIWIKALFCRYHENGGINNTKIITRWLEQENQDNPSKCDKISLSFHTKENENVLTITVNVTAGRIKAQGRFYKEWGAKEFDQLLAMVNSPQDTWKVDNIKPFVESILKEDKIDLQPLEKTKQALSEESTTPNTSRDKTFSQMRLQLANIEAEFVLHRENTKQTISELSQSIETKDKEIVSLKNTEKEKQQIISDLTLKLLQMEENINALNKRSNKGDNTNEHVELESKGNKEENVEDGVEQNDNIQQDLPPTVQPNTSAQPETKTDHQKSIDAETIIICDSNGRYLKPKELCPDSTTKYIRSPTLSQARQKIESFNFSNPKNLIIHCGTNDIEQPGKNTITETLEIVDLVKQKHPNCRILVSSLLSRKDELNNKVPTINEELKTRLSSKTKTTYIQHTNISSADLHDKKHLNERGVKKFAKNIKAAYFNTTPKKKEMNKKYPPRDIHNQNFPQHMRTQPFQFGRNNIYPPFTPIIPTPSSPPSYQHRINTQHINKGTGPPPPSFCQDNRINTLPPQL
ncbi:Hypothetical predicted protein, partial [Paramuricea clavata]